MTYGRAVGASGLGTSGGGGGWHDILFLPRGVVHLSNLLKVCFREIVTES